MNIYEYAESLLFGDTFEKKTSLISDLDTKFTEYSPISSPQNPSRSNRIKFSDKQVKFPKGESVKEPAKMAKALHFFANHELLAIEMMAAAILVYPTRNKEDHDFKLGLIPTIKDEIKHLKLYSNRINELGLEFGDLPLNDYFWKHMGQLKTPSQFYALMALTFETANLDFANHFHYLFKKVGDEKSSEIMKIVYEDEIKHVSRGALWLGKWKKDKSLWQYYVESLPEFITPARSKGQVFDADARKRAGLDDDFIKFSKSYKDNFDITNRKSWK